MRRCRIESMGVSLPGRRFLGGGSMRQALRAGRKCLKSSRHSPSDLGVLINSGVHRDGHICEPAVAVMIQRRLGINTDFQGVPTLSFDLLDGACGMLGAVQVATALLQNGQVRAALIVSSEANRDRHPDPAYPYPASGAALILDISPRPQTGFGSFVSHTRDEYSEWFTSIVDLGVKRGRILMHREPKLEEIYLAMLPPLVDELLEKEGLDRQEIDRVIPAQLSPAFLDRLPSAVGVSGEKIADFRSRLPDTHSTSVALALHRSIRQNPPKQGEKVLLLAFGSGVTAAGTIYHF